MSRVRESRAYDFHYDPVFTVSHERPRMGGIPAWSNSVRQVNSVPQRAPYRSAPRQSINAQAQFNQTRLAATMVPAIMPDGTIGRVPAPAAAAGAGAGASAAAAQPRVRGAGGRILTQAQLADQRSAEILGPSRVKFFKRPVVPFLAAAQGGEMEGMEGFDQHAGAAYLDPDAPDQSSQPLESEPAHRTMGTQSDYRESETQTDPYTPDYITAPDEPEPEILGLAHLTYGQGLPAAMDELQLIRRMREKKEFEASLPPLTDAASFALRKKMLEERELAEWALREEEMQEEQAARLQVLVDTLKDRESKVEALSEARVELIRSQRMQQRDEAFDAIQHERIKLQRALGKERQRVEDATAHMSGGYKEKTASHSSSASRRTANRDIIAEYADHSSQVYAPVTRQGQLPMKNQVVEYGIPLLQSFAGLTQLEQRLPSRATAVPVRAPTIQLPSMATRKGQAIRADLEYVDQLLEEQRREGGAVGITGEAKANYHRRQRLVENVYKKFEPVQRAPTPTVVAPPQEDARRAILLLQRLLRGRLVQNAMFEGKQHHKPLIDELRLEEEEQQEAPQPQELALHHALSLVQGEVVASALCQVREEVVRASQERAVAALVQQAQLTRRHREAEESGRRQAEQLQRLKRERQMAEVLADHSLTADRYLAELMERSIQRHAARCAHRSAQVQQQAVEPTIQQIEQQQAQSSSSSSADSSSSVVCDLMSNFLLPEVERRKQERRTQLEERRFLQQAHQAMTQALEHMQK